MNSLTHWDKQTTKGRMSKRTTKRTTQRIIKEKWYNGRVYLHIPFVPFKIRIA